MWTRGSWYFGAQNASDRTTCDGTRGTLGGVRRPSSRKDATNMARRTESPLVHSAAREKTERSRRCLLRDIAHDRSPSPFPSPRVIERLSLEGYSSNTAARVSRRLGSSPSALLLILTMLLAPGLLDCSVKKGREGQGVRVADAASCSSSSTGTGVTQLAIAPSTNNSDLSSYFDCEDGTFNVSWSGTVTIQNTIRIGNRTTVTITGDYDNGLLTRDYKNALINGDDVATNATAETESTEAVIIAGDFLGSIFELQFASLHLENIAFRNGTAANSTSLSEDTTLGGGVHALDSDVTITGCEFQDMYAEFWGAAIFSNRSRVEIRDTVFRQCTAGEEAFAGDEEEPIGAGGGIGAWSTDLLVDNCVFEDGYAGDKGAGIQHARGNITVKNSLFWRNRVGSNNLDEEDFFGEGGDFSTNACYHEYGGTSGICLITDSAFYHSRAGIKGAVINIGSGATHIEFNRGYVNNATCGKDFEDDPQGEGGAFAVAAGATITVRDSVVTDTNVGKKGGAIMLSSNSSSDSWEYPGGTAVVINSTFANCSASRDVGGVVYLNQYTTLNITGDASRFEGNKVIKDGAVVGATVNTRVFIEGGVFYRNDAVEDGGVIMSPSNVTIRGGEFIENSCLQKGGVWFGSDGDSFFVVEGGVFRGNTGGAGGVGYVDTYADARINGGIYEANQAEHGGVFFVGADAKFEVNNGSYMHNEADFGGFIHKEGQGNATCSGAYVANNTGLNGGAIYAFGGANLDWQCELVNNSAVSGAAIYAWDKASITLRNTEVVNNTVARGSIVFMVESSLRTYRVNFVDFSKSPDVSALQADEMSSYIAQDTAFRGYQGEAVVYSRGDLYLDSCDFSHSSASILVDGSEGKTFVRNAILGNDNYEGPMEEAGTEVFPNVLSIISVNLSCDTIGDEHGCSEGSTCVDGDLGVYCQCYIPKFTRKETCISNEADALSVATVETTKSENESYVLSPNLITGDLSLTLAAGNAGGSTSSEGQGVVWKVLTESMDLVDWEVFPANGLLLPGQSIIARVVGEASSAFEGEQNFTFRVEVIGSSASESKQVATATTPVMAATASSPLREVTFPVTFYHCEIGNLWKESDNICEPCNEVEVGDADGLNCEQPGVSTHNLPILPGYWKAAISSIVIRECLNEDACVGGTNAAEVSEYCDDGYEGPYCAVCSSGYGRGVANTCHECTDAFRAGMLFVLTLAALLTVGVGTLLAIYLVGGTVAVSSTIDTTRESVRTLRRRSSNLLMSFTSMRAVSTRLGRSTSQSAGQPYHTGTEGIDASGEDSSHAPMRFQLRKSFPMTRAITGASGSPRRKAFRVRQPSFGTSMGYFSDPDSNAGSERGLTATGRLQRKEFQERDETKLDDNWEILYPDLTEATAQPKNAKDDGNEPTSTNTKSGTGKDGRIKLRTDSAKTFKGRWRPAILPVASSARGFSFSSVCKPPRQNKPHLPSHEDGGSDVNENTQRMGTEQEQESKDVCSSTLEKPQGGSSGVGDTGVDSKESPGLSSVSGGLEVPTAARAQVGWALNRDGGTGKGDGEVSIAGSVDKVPVKKSAAARIGDFLAILPLSKLKIVIVVWQITSAFAEITQVPFPPIYEKFLATIGLFTFDLGWFLSASCLTTKITFYDKLLFVTIGPTVLLAILSITFHIGSQKRFLDQAKPLYPTLDTSDISGSERSQSCTPLPGDMDVEASSHNVDRFGGIQKGSSVQSVASDQPTKRSLDWESMSISWSKWERVIPGMNPPSRGIGPSQPSRQSIWRTGPGKCPDGDQNQLWKLFTRHATMMLIILYLVYSQVSTVVFQTFSCAHFDEVGKHYLWADFKIECYTPKHNAYMMYAGVMIVIYPFGIPAAFWYFLNRQRSRINPEVDAELEEDAHMPHVLEKKMEKRMNDETVTPTYFLWSAYLPHRYYYEVLECARRLLLTGLLVFMVQDKPEQVAISCIMAFLSLLGFELLRPYSDNLDSQLYRTGCLVIFFSNFLGLMIKAEVAQPESNSSAIFSVILIAVNILFFLSIWGNAYVSTTVLFSRGHVQGNLLGVDIVPEDQFDEMMPVKARKSTGGGDSGLLSCKGRWTSAELDPPQEIEEALPAWEREISATTEDVLHSQISRTSGHQDLHVAPWQSSAAAPLNIGVADPGVRPRATSISRLKPVAHAPFDQTLGVHSLRDPGLDSSLSSSSKTPSMDKVQGGGAHTFIASNLSALEYDPASVPSPASRVAITPGVAPSFFLFVS